MARKIFDLLIDNLEAQSISYCHWKSNINLDRALAGHDDLDLLISRKNSASFEAIILSLGFKEASGKNADYPSIKHCYGYDDQTGDIVHLHAYYRIITSGSILKNYRLPLEEMLLQNTRYIGAVRVPTKAAELAIFVIRKMLEHTNLFDMLLFYRRESKHARKELEWLSNEQTRMQAAELLRHWLPAVDTQLFLEIVKSLKPDGAITRRVLLARRLSTSLKNYRIHGLLSSAFVRNSKLTKTAIRRILSRKNRRTLITGGSVIGIVGPEATGKSTICTEISNWLGDHFCVEAVHVGKPTSTWLTVLPNLAVPFLRKMLPSHRSNEIKRNLWKKEQSKKTRGLQPLVFAIRSIMLAFDRSTLLRKVFRKASSGAVVICDRYPTYTTGAMDSSQLDVSQYKPGRFSIGYRLAKLENRIYKNIPPPDIVIKLTVPVEIAIGRNTIRNKKGSVEDEEFVKIRHSQSDKQNYVTACEHSFNTNRSQPETIREVKRLIWENL